MYTLFFDYFSALLQLYNYYSATLLLITRYTIVYRIVIILLPE